MSTAKPAKTRKIAVKVVIEEPLLQPFPRNWITNKPRSGRGPQADMGDRITGRDVTGGSLVTGTVIAVIGPIKSPDCMGYRYRIADTGQVYASGRPVEPIVFFGRHA